LHQIFFTDRYLFILKSIQKSGCDCILGFDPKKVSLRTRIPPNNLIENRQKFDSEAVSKTFEIKSVAITVEKLSKKLHLEQGLYSAQWKN